MSLKNEIILTFCGPNQISQNVKEVIGWSVVKRIPMNVWWHRLIKLKRSSKYHLFSLGAVSLHMD